MSAPPSKPQPQTDHQAGAGGLSLSSVPISSVHIQRGGGGQHLKRDCVSPDSDGVTVMISAESRCLGWGPGTGLLSGSDQGPPDTRQVMLLPEPGGDDEP
jgi:hypothetical protein